LKYFVPALVISLALSVADTEGALAVTVPSPSANPTAQSTGGAPTTSDSAHPLVMQQVGNEVATAPPGPLKPFSAQPRTPAAGSPAGLQREVFGFALTSSLSDPTIGYPSWNFQLLSTVAIFGLHVRDDGTIAPDSGYSVWSSSQMTGLMAAARSAGTKVVITIILQDFGAGTPHMCAGLANRASTVAQTVAEVKAKGADGVNLDYEGLQTSCGNGVSPRVAMTDLVRQMKAALPAGSYLSVDTYASSAGDPAGFFDIPGMNASTDSFFVMAYDSDRSNYGHAPLNCATYCLSPVSPLTGYYYNDTRAAAEYTTAVPASKVILGLPYYSRGGCVPNGSPNQTPPARPWALGYRASASIASDPTNSAYVLHRDANDPSGMTPWSTWTSNSSPPCQTEEMYWDDVTSLGQKYDLVNRAGLRGVGLWNLNFGGGSPELWSTLSTYFACPSSISVPTSPTTTEFAITLGASGCDVASFEVQQYDSTLNQGWYPLKPVAASGSAGSELADGYPGYSYQFRARAHSRAGLIGGWSTGSTTVAAGATPSHPFQGLYTLDGYGGVHAVDSPPLSDSAYWAGWTIARAVKAVPAPAAPRSGFVLDGYGGLHPYGAPGLTETGGSWGHYWQGQDIARDFAFLPDGTGGFVLDGYGGLHPFRLNGSTAPLQAQGFTYWPGWDIARKVVVFGDGSGGYVLDGYGGLHPFGINGPPPPSANTIVGGGYWQGWQIVRDVVLLPGNGFHSGYLLDGEGGIHPFHSGGDRSVMPAAITGTPYWTGWDIARSLWLAGDSTAAAPKGYVLDGYGGLHQFGGSPAISSSTYWQGWDIARFVWGA
jgi:spore germination protein YaaH